MASSFFVASDLAFARRLLSLRTLAANDNAPLEPVLSLKHADGAALANRPVAQRARIRDICAKVGSLRATASFWP